MKIFGFAGFSGSGKTTLIEQLIPIFVERQLKVALIKHAHHKFEIDHPRKDSYRHRRAGATEVLIASAKRWALIGELGDEPEPTLARHLERLSPCDLVLVEGFKREPIPKLEILRAGTDAPFLHTKDRNVVAVASDTAIATGLPVLDLNQPLLIAEFIVRHLQLNHSPSQTWEALRRIA